MTTAAEVVQQIICPECDMAMRQGICKKLERDSCSLFVRAEEIAQKSMRQQLANIAEDLAKRAQIGETLSHVAEKYAEQAEEGAA